MSTLAPGDRQLTPHFRLSEFAVSAAHPDLVRPVPTALQPSIARVAAVLERIRMEIGRPMQILSGYRAPALNKAVGGSKTSQHVLGEAADFTCHDIRGAFEKVIGLVQLHLLGDAGQIIYYPTQGFVHVAVDSPRFPHATVCVHWPERGMKYRPFTPTLIAFNQLMPDNGPVNV